MVPLGFVNDTSVFVLMYEQQTTEPQEITPNK
jgi:hypothetical protein